MKTWRLLAGLGAVLATACGPRADDINKVQPGYVRKSIFTQPSDWYYRRTIVKSETTNAYVVEGSGDLAVNYNTEPTGGDGDLPGGWGAGSADGLYGHYNRFTYRDR